MPVKTSSARMRLLRPAAVCPGRHAARRGAAPVATTAAAREQQGGEQSAGQRHAPISTDHRPKTPASTRATPSSSWPGATWSAAAIDRRVGVGHGVRRAGPGRASAGRWACRRRRSRRPRRCRGRRTSSASVEALVTPGALISSSDGRRGPGDHQPALHDLLGERPRTPAASSSSWRASSLSAGRSKSSAIGARRAPSGTRCRSRNSGSRPIPSSVSTANDRAGQRRRAAARTPRAPSAGSIGPLEVRPVPRDVPDERAVGDDREAVRPDVLEDLLGPAQRPAGHEHDRDAERLDRGEDLGGVRRDAAVAADQGAVEVGGDEPGSSVDLNHRAAGGPSRARRPRWRRAAR